MLGRPEWFRRRKYGGWGYWPATWQGWVYLAAVLFALFGIQYLPFPDERYKVVAMTIWAVLVLLDSLDIMYRIPKDERERLHEAIAERNALWAMVVVLCAGVGYQAAASAVKGDLTMDPVILAALIAGVTAKAASNIYLDRKS